MSAYGGSGAVQASHRERPTRALWPVLRRTVRTPMKLAMTAPSAKKISSTR